ncbi:serotransferrin-like isoform X2 [Oculina patagonica]
MVFSTKEGLLLLLCCCLALKGVKASISFRWCALPAEKAKCADFIKYVNVTARNLSLDVTTACVDGSDTDDCIAKIKNNQADLVTLNGRKVYDAGTKSSLIPIVSEQYGDDQLRYYGAAVVKKANTGFNIKTLKGKKSCHTGIRRNAGWNIPIGYLLRSKIMLAVACGNENNDYMSASKFFSESCLPGVDSTAFSNLCALCAGTGADKCSTNSSINKYVSHSGAFKCMADGKGDVAFLKHSIAEKMATSGEYGNSANYEYLCKDGTRKAIGQFRTCNLGYSPAHAVVTRRGNSNITNITEILTKMSDWYGDKQRDWKKFQLFNSTTFSGSDLIFDDSTTELEGIADDKQTYMGYLGDDFVKDLEALESCVGVKRASTPAPPAPTAGAMVTSPATELVLLIALFGVLFL